MIGGFGIGASCLSSRGTAITLHSSLPPVKHEDQNVGLYPSRASAIIFNFHVMINSIITADDLVVGRRLKGAVNNAAIK